MGDSALPAFVTAGRAPKVEGEYVTFWGTAFVCEL
jgi:hypothetical protein